MNNLEWKLALKFLFAKRRQRFLSTAGIVAILGLSFGVAALLVALSVIQGFQSEYKKSILGFNAHVILLKSDEISHPEQALEGLEKYQTQGEKTGATPFIYREGMVVSSSLVKGIVLKGVDFERYQKLSHLSVQRRPQAAEENPEHLPEVLLGKTLAEQLSLKDHVLRILFPQGLKPEELGSKNIKRFFVAGTFESGLFEYDSSFVLISLPEAERFFQTDGKVSGLEIWLDDPDHAVSWARAMRKDYPYPYAVMTWYELNENVFRALKMEKLIFAILMTVLVIVAVLNLVGTLMMLLLERRGDVSILKSYGLSWRRIRKVFLFDGLLIGSAGIALGLLLGGGLLFWLKRWHPISLSPEIYFVKQIPVDWSWSMVGLIVIVTLTIVVLACEWALRKVNTISVSQALLEASK